MPLFSMNMLRTISRAAGLNWLHDDLELGVATADEAIMGTNEGIRLKCDNVGELLGVIDQQGLIDCK
ncbi:hypothetical protein CROQUDRAFT_86054 [Cronartium quercuum f. sp. fusiforme G11]|uniref:Uncharacterized protein n=1 Tax=Cronartium quercuum f. sp. fusiforme G11 TaxID=708437 RepID=A0A9P6NWY3_9BASI|nr:hypothetical protein CROQUDRAFT_86054 [Cronartium quercuum f. sp. fusiforme G11]